jgi:glycerol uptake facilitator protein
LTGASRRPNFTETLFGIVEQADGGDSSSDFQGGGVHPSRPDRAPRQDTGMESNSTAQRWLAEALGTGFLVFIGAGSIPATLILGNAGKVPFSMADLGMISFAFMLVIVGMVYAVGHISGCHINPAVTVSLAVTGKFPWKDVPGYVVAQVVGATAGALAIVGTLGKTASDLGLGMTTYGDSTPWARATFAEFIGTALLAFVIFGVIDGRAVPGWAGLAIGSIVFAIIIVVGPATGAALNPARYVGPMLTGELFDATVKWAQLPAYFIGEFVGAIAGAFAYITMARTRPSIVPTQSSRATQEVTA